MGGDISRSDIDLWEALRRDKESLKLRELKTLADVAYTKIKDHADSLGVEISGQPEHKISFKDKDSKNLGLYLDESDEIRVDSNSIKIIIHEELHFAGAVDNRSAKRNMGENRLAKTGFKSVWKSRDENNQSKDLLRSLNEAVTEKMASEIFQNSKEAIITEVIKADPKIVELNDKLAAQEQALAWSEAQRYLPGKFKACQDNIFMQEYEMEKLSYEELAAQERRNIELKFKADLFSVRSQDIIKELDTYHNEIMVLDAILERLSQARASQENISISHARVEEWQAMQRAYLKGETIYLRRIEKIIGPSLLREFNDVDIRKVNSGAESREDYEPKINNLIERINNI